MMTAGATDEMDGGCKHRRVLSAKAISHFGINRPGARDNPSGANKRPEHRFPSSCFFVGEYEHAYSRRLCNSAAFSARFSHCPFKPRAILIAIHRRAMRKRYAIIILWA